MLPQELQTQFAQTMIKNFIGREEEISEISEKMHDNSCRYFELVGQAGAGKTSLLAKLLDKRVSPCDLHFAYFAKLFGDFSEESLLRQICADFNQHLGIGYISTAANLEELKEDLTFLSLSLPPSQSVCFYFDDLDLLTNPSWIIDCLSELFFAKSQFVFTHQSKSFATAETFIVFPMEAPFFLTEVTATHPKSNWTIEDNFVAPLTFQSSLYLLGEMDFTSLESKNIAFELSAIWGKIFDCIEKEMKGKGELQRWIFEMRTLSCSRKGLPEESFRNIMEMNFPTLSEGPFLFSLLEPFVVFSYVPEGRYINFSHQEIRDIVYMRYLNEGSQLQIHKKVADELLHRDPVGRSCDCIYHLWKSNQKSILNDIIEKNYNLLCKETDHQWLEELFLAVINVNIDGDSVEDDKYLCHLISRLEPLKFSKKRIIHQLFSSNNWGIFMRNLSHFDSLEIFHFSVMWVIKQKKISSRSVASRQCRILMSEVKRHIEDVSKVKEYLRKHQSFMSWWIFEVSDYVSPANLRQFLFFSGSNKFAEKAFAESFSYFVKEDKRNDLIGFRSLNCIENAESLSNLMINYIKALIEVDLFDQAWLYLKKMESFAQKDFHSIFQFEELLVTFLEALGQSETIVHQDKLDFLEKVIGVTSLFRRHQRILSQIAVAYAAIGDYEGCLEYIRHLGNHREQRLASQEVLQKLGIKENTSIDFVALEGFLDSLEDFSKTWPDCSYRFYQELYIVRIHLGEWENILGKLIDLRYEPAKTKVLEEVFSYLKEHDTYPSRDTFQETLDSFSVGRPKVETLLALALLYREVDISLVFVIMQEVVDIFAQDSSLVPPLLVSFSETLNQMPSKEVPNDLISFCIHSRDSLTEEDRVRVIVNIAKLYNEQGRIHECLDYLDEAATALTGDAESSKTLDQYGLEIVELYLEWQEPERACEAACSISTPDIRFEALSQIFEYMPGVRNVLIWDNCQNKLKKLVYEGNHIAYLLRALTLLPERNRNFLGGVLFSGISATGDSSRRRERLRYTINCLYKSIDYRCDFDFYAKFLEQIDALAEVDRLEMHLYLAFKYYLMGEADKGESLLDRSNDIVVGRLINQTKSIVYYNNIRKKLMTTFVHSLVTSSRSEEAMRIHTSMTPSKQKQESASYILDSFVVNQQWKEALRFIALNYTSAKKEECYFALAQAMISSRELENLEATLNKMQDYEKISAILNLLLAEDDQIYFTGNCFFIENLLVTFRENQEGLKSYSLEKFWALLDEEDISLHLFLLSVFTVLQVTSEVINIESDLQRLLEVIQQENLITFLPRWFEILLKFPGKKMELLFQEGLQTLPEMNRYEKVRLLGEISLVASKNNYYKLTSEILSRSFALIEEESHLYNEDVLSNFCLSALRVGDLEYVHTIFQLLDQSEFIWHNILQRVDVQEYPDFIRFLRETIQSKNVNKKVECHILLFLMRILKEKHYGDRVFQILNGAAKEEEGKIAREILLAVHNKEHAINLYPTLLQIEDYLMTRALHIPLRDFFDIVDQIYPKDIRFLRLLLRSLLKHLEKEESQALAEKIFTLLLPTIGVKELVEAIIASGLSHKTLGEVIIDLQKAIVCKFSSPLQEFRKTFVLMTHVPGQKKIIHYTISMLQACYIKERREFFPNIENIFTFFESDDILKLL